MVKALVEYFIKSLVSQPDKVQVTLKTDQNKQIIGIYVVQEDRGRAIGKDGKTIKAIRQCIESLVDRDEHTHFIIDFVDNPQIN